MLGQETKLKRKFALWMPGRSFSSTQTTCQGSAIKEYKARREKLQLVTIIIHQQCSLLVSVQSRSCPEQKRFLQLVKKVIAKKVLEVPRQRELEAALHCGTC